MKRKFYSLIFGLSALLLVGFANLNASSTVLSFDNSPQDCVNSDIYTVNDVLLNTLSSDHSLGFLITVIDILEFEENINSNRDLAFLGCQHNHVSQNTILKCLSIDYQKCKASYVADNSKASKKIYLKNRVFLI